MDKNLNRICENVYFISDSTNIGVISEKTPDALNIYLVDAGCAPDRGKIILDILEEYFYKKDKTKCKIKAVICTHAHQDHVHAAFYFKEKTGCEIWCTRKERGNLENPEYEQAIICGGFPLPELEAPLYKAKPVYDVKIVEPDSAFTLSDGTEINLIGLPGHHFEMIGVLVKTKTEKTVLFAADAIFGRAHMKKYWIPFLLDEGRFKMSLRKITDLHSDYLLPSHGELLNSAEAEALAELNRYALVSTEKAVLEILKKPHTAEDLLKAIADINHINLGLAQFILIGCTIRSYLSYLYRSGKISFFIKDNRMLWRAVKLKKGGQ
ncbi:MBL fold metallo-hydrolase [Treponema parvum]|uniref:MBL fold metallo-hydrolase n=1 Tax=Treponema parvum TaxID=138851 RepID=A0A975ICC8_9SPIR|nr:MBL fold metallo-hydrolase [Treponema parvum]QTQ11578.1 MBL fold metallo-hydrolase [Treponema parvum]QTQ16473.1 MBL fold metallo-hydrolase [Treponema parvum]